MVRNALCATIVACAALMSGSHAQAPNEPSLPRLVVGSFEEQGVATGLGDIVADLITQSIDSSKVQLVERRQVKRVLDEQAVASSDLTQPGNAVRYGKLADSRLVLLGSVYRVDGVYYVSARIVNVDTGIVSEGSRATAKFSTVDEMVLQIPGLVRAIGLCDECPPISAALEVQRSANAVGVAPSTVKDYLERPGSRSRHVDISIAGGSRRATVGRELQFQVRSPQQGYLSLFVVDALGAVSMLVPNGAVQRMAVSADVAVDVPRDAGFKLMATPPLGMTRVKAIVTPSPLPLVGSPDAAGLLRRVAMDQSIAARDGAAEQEIGESNWLSGELEFLVVNADPSADDAPANRASPVGQPPLPRTPDAAPRSSGAAASSAELSVQRAPEIVLAALARVQESSSVTSPEDSRSLQWPLRTPFAGGVDIGQAITPKDAAQGPCIAVIDADFDPDDPVLERALRNLDSAAKEALREEIRRNGHAAIRHGNRVASLIAGDAPWLPSVAPGAEIRPIRVTTTIDGPEYRIDRGKAAELIAALRTALTGGCKIVNLSLSVSIEGPELEAFKADPIWDDLERADVLVVCAAGNSGDDIDAKPTFPACLERSNILCVGAVQPDGRVATWDKGGSSVGSRSVDVMAPGTLLAVSDGAGRIGIASGTSYASALASGTAARWLQQEPYLKPHQLIRLLLDTATRHPDLATACRSGIIRCPK